MSRFELDGNPDQPVQTPQNIAQQHQRINQVKKILQSLSKQLEFRETASTLEGTPCIVSGLQNIPISKIQSKLPHYCELKSGPSFNILIHSPSSRRWSKTQYFLVFLLIGLIFILLNWKKIIHARPSFW